MDNKIIINLDAIVDWVFTGDNNRATNVEIKERVIKDKDDKVVNSERDVTETKVADVSKQTVKFELVRRMLDVLDEIPIDDDGEIVPGSLGMEATLNTLEEYGFIAEGNNGH